MKTLFKTVIQFLILTFGICFGFDAAGAPPQVTTLPNGITVVLQEDHSSPVVAIQYWVKAGSRTEVDREAGITHLIEHMIFKGTHRRGVGEVAGEIEAAGGEINAYTSFDYTVYHVTIASRYADVGLEVLTDAVMNAIYDPEELEREKKVVLEELRMREDRPAGKLQKALFAKAFQVHPYRRPIIGYVDSVSSFKHDDVMDYVNRMYSAGNIILVVAGDIEPAKTLERIGKLLSDWPERELRIATTPSEPPQKGMRAVVLKEAVTEAHMQVAFHIPPVYHTDVPALDVLALILGVGESSRLERRVKDEMGLVYSVGAYAFTPMDSGIFLIQSTLKPENVESAFTAILKEAYELLQNGISKDELEKARVNIETDFVEMKETMQGKARNLGYFQTVFRDLDRERVYLEAIRRVTKEEIQRVAEKYLRPDQCTVAILIPQTSALMISQQDLERIAGEAWGDQMKSSRAEQVGEAPELQVRREVLQNGMTLVVKEDHAVPTVAIQAVFLGGSRYERAEIAGISAFLARLLTKGTRSRSAGELAVEIESKAGSLEGYSGRNSLGAQAEFLSRFFPEAMDLLSDVLLNPVFDPREMEKERERLIAAVRREKDQATRMVFQAFAETIFRTHPYGFRSLGTEESLKKITREDILTYYERVFHPENLVLTIVGDVEFDKALLWTKRYFDRWEGSGFQPAVVSQEPPLSEPRIVRKSSPKHQVHIVLGFLGAKIGEPDQYPLEVLDTVLSGQGGRLFQKLRDQQGLAYSVTSFSRAGLDPGYFGTYIGTAPQNLDRAISGLKEELDRVTRERVAQDELERAKRYIVGRYEIGLQTHAAQALTMALDERYGLGFDYGKRYIQRIQSVTLDDVLRVARKYIDLERYVIAIVGPDAQ